MSDKFHNHGMEGTETQEEIEQAKISTSQSQASTSNNDVLLDFRDAVLLGQLQQLRRELNTTKIQPEEESRAEIKSTPEFMRRSANYEKNFKPRELLIGPIYFRYRWDRVRFSGNHSIGSITGEVIPGYNDAYFLELKLKLAAHFISESGGTTEDILKDFKSKTCGIRTCFEEDIIEDYEDQELMRLMFLGGCAILGFILSYVNQRLNVVNISDAKAAVIEQDLLLIENQIPFQVLEVLMGSGTDEGKKNMKESFFRFIYLISNSTFRRDSPKHVYAYLDKYCFSPDVNKNQKPAHLLDLFRETLLFNPCSFDSGYMLILVRGIFWTLCSCGFVAICCMLERFHKESYDIISWKRTKRFFHSVQELKAAGIKFKPSHSLTTISFHSRFFVTPQLTLPTFIVDDSTAYKLFNLVAYEMSLSESHPNKTPWVTSYVNLLDSLIDNEQDIKDLRAADILRNTLSTDVLAAEFINEVGTKCSAPTEDACAGVKDKTEKYYRTTCAMWMAQVCDTHFSSPL